MVEDNECQECVKVFLPKVSSATLKRVIEFTKLYKDHPCKKIIFCFVNHSMPPFFSQIFLSLIFSIVGSIKTPINSAIESIPKRHLDFVNIDYMLLIALYAAADFMEMDLLMDLVSMELAFHFFVSLGGSLFVMFVFG